MKIGVTADAYEDIRINGLLNELYDKKFTSFFESKDYGNEVEIFIVIVGYPKELRLLKRYDSKDATLYWDIKLDYSIMKKAKKIEKKKILSNIIIDSFDILDEYKKLHIDKDRLKEDAKKYFDSIDWRKGD